MTVRAVVFDIGNVLVGWAPEAFFDRAVGPERRAAFFAAVDFAALNESIDAGAPFEASLRRAQETYPDFAAELRLWRSRFIEMLDPVLDHSVRLLRALRRAGVPVFALSNFGAETFEMAQREFPFLEEFDQFYISGRMGVIKPDPQIFERLEAECGVAPGDLLFTDDRPENIAVASARGWQTHLFDGPEGWGARLVAEGLVAREAAE